MELGAKVVTVSDSSGTIIDEDGFTPEKLAILMDVKNHHYGRVSDYAARTGVKFEAGVRPWHVPVDIALPCATQNELDENDAQLLIKNGVLCVAEGANMPSTIEAAKAFEKPLACCTPPAGIQRRWRGHFRPGNEPERHAHELDPRRSGRPSAADHAKASTPPA